jgi:hypothetical protein
MPQARRARARRGPPSSTATSTRRSPGSAASSSLPPPKAPDDLPRLAREQLVAVDGHAAAKRLRGRRRAQRADGVGERAERALEGPGADGGDDRQTDAGGVEERPLAGAEHVDDALAPAARGQQACLVEVERDLHGPREVVRRARRDDGQGQAAGRGGHGHGADRAVPAGHHEPVGVRGGRLARRARVVARVEGVHADLRPRLPQALGDVIGVRALAGRGVRHEGQTHERGSCP